MSTQKISPYDEKHNHLSNILLRTIRLIPVFFGFSMFSCLVGRFVFHIPLDRLAVVASVPCLVGFGITRVLNIVLASPPPRTHSAATVTPSRTFRVSAILIFFAAFTGLDFSISAAIYYGLGLHSIVDGTLRIGAGSLVVALGTIVIAIVRTMSDEFKANIILAAERVLMCPTRISNFLAGQGWGKTTHW